MKTTNKEHDTDTWQFKFKRHFQAKLMNGLVKLAPMLITIIVIFVLIGYADSFFRPMFFISGKPWDVTGVGVALALVLLYAAGWLVSSGLGVTAVENTENITRKLPFVGSVFNISHQVISSFTRVVFLEWPRSHFVAIGFVTGRTYNTRTGKPLVVVYIPTVPNPTSGNLAFVDEDYIIETDITAEDAMKLVFSGGISIPENFALARVPFETTTANFDMLGAYTLDFKNVDASVGGEPKE